MPSAKSVPASTSSAARTPRRTSRRRSTARPSPTTTASSSGKRKAARTWRSAPTSCGSASSSSTKRRRSIRRWTKRCSTTSSAARRRSRIPTSSVVKKSPQCRHDGLGGVFLNQVPGAGDGAQACSGNLALQLSAALYWDPATAPQDQGRTAYFAIARRDLVGVFLIHLRDLAIEGCLAHFAQPRRSEEHTSELQSLAYLVCRLLLEKKKTTLLSRSHSLISPWPHAAMRTAE